MRRVLGAGALGRPRGVGWVGRWEGGSGWGIHVNPWLIHVDVWSKPLQEKKKKKKSLVFPYINNEKTEREIKEIIPFTGSLLSESVIENWRWTLQHLESVLT